VALEVQQPEVVLRQQPHNIAPAGDSMPSSPASDRSVQPALIASPIKGTASYSAVQATVVRPLQPSAAAASATSPAASRAAGERDNLQQHPNLATAGVPGASGPRAILQITLQVRQPFECTIAVWLATATECAKFQRLLMMGCDSLQEWTSSRALQPLQASGVSACMTVHSTGLNSRADASYYDLPP
jgi:hypothetical protein